MILIKFDQICFFLQSLQSNIQPFYQRSIYPQHLLNCDQQPLVKGFDNSRMDPSSLVKGVEMIAKQTCQFKPCWFIALLSRA